MSNLLNVVKIFLIDDHQIVREGLKQLLESDPNDAVVVGMASTAKEGLELVQAAAPDLVILDLSLPDHDGIWLTRELRRHNSELPLLALSMHAKREKILAVLEAGANGYVTKSASKETLRYAIRNIMDGGSFLEPRITATVLRSIQEKENEDAVLSSREIKILELVAQDQNNNDISTELLLSEGTVKSHLTAIFKKLGVRSRAGAVAKAMNLGII